MKREKERDNPLLLLLLYLFRLLLREGLRFIHLGRPLFASSSSPSSQQTHAQKKIIYFKKGPFIYILNPNPPCLGVLNPSGFVEKTTNTKEAKKKV